MWLSVALWMLPGGEQDFVSVLLWLEGRAMGWPSNKTDWGGCTVLLWDLISWIIWNFVSRLKLVLEVFRKWNWQIYRRLVKRKKGLPAQCFPAVWRNYIYLLVVRCHRKSLEGLMFPRLETFLFNVWILALEYTFITGQIWKSFNNLAF